jgi:hypothetical protein
LSTRGSSFHTHNTTQVAQQIESSNCRSVSKKSATGGCGKAEHLKKKKIFGPKVFDFFGQIIFWLTFYKNKFV